MVQQNLVSYVIAQLRQGRRLEDVNKFLVQSGYDKAEVESAVQYVINTQTNPQVAEQQRIQQLVGYIQKQLQGGYDKQAVANFLVSRGYPYFEVNSALQKATAPPQELKLHHKALIFAFIAMFVMTAGVTFMYLKAYTRVGVEIPDQLLDVEVEKLTTLVQQGGELTFRVKLINFGFDKRFDVVLNYNIIDRDTQDTVLEKSETMALSTTMENIVTFEIPGTMPPGDYVVRVDAVYQDFTATSGFIFNLISKDIAEETLEEIRAMMPEEEENISEIPELAPTEPEGPTPVEPEEPTAEEPVTVTPTVPTPEEGEPAFYEGITRQQAFDMVKSTYLRNPEQALSMCREFKHQGNVDKCLTDLAKFQSDGSLCEEIEKEIAKDSCYLDIAIETADDSFCDMITAPQLRSTCRMFSMIDALKKSGESQIGSSFG